MLLIDVLHVKYAYRLIHPSAWNFAKREKDGREYSFKELPTIVFKICEIDSFEKFCFEGEKLKLCSLIFSI